MNGDGVEPFIVEAIMLQLSHRSTHRGSPIHLSSMCKDTKNIRKMYNSHRLTQMAAKNTQGKTVFGRIAALLMLAVGIAAGWLLRGCSSGAFFQSGVKL